MRKLVFFFFIATQLITAQKKDITLEDIWSYGTFRTERLNSFTASKKGDYYTLLEYNPQDQSTRIDKYNFETLEKTATLVNSNDIDGLDGFENYEFNQDETAVLLSTDSEQIYRHSSVATFYVYDLTNKKLTAVSDKKIQDPAFSPDGTKVAYAFENNIYIKDLVNNSTIQVTSDGERNKIINGITDWVYEEEFGFVRAFQWNPASSKLAFIRFDETEVPEFSMDMYGDGLYPVPQVFKYPKAGEKNSLVSLHIFDLDSNTNKQLNLAEKAQYYIPRIQWGNEPNALVVTTLNRHQNNLNLIFVDVVTLNSWVVLNEKDAAYVDIHDNLTFLKDGSFIWTSERDGYNHIYHYKADGHLINQVTQGPWEVTSFYGYDENSKRIFYQSTEDGSINRTLYSVKLNGKGKMRLSKAAGTNSATFSNSFKYYINNYSDAQTPPVYTLNDDANGKEIKEILNNNTLLEKWAEYKTSPKEFFVLKTKNGDFNAWMIKPVNFDPAKKYPLFMYQYSGPGSQSVSNSWMGYNDYWYELLAEKGYIIACVDGRGTGFKGRDFKKITYKELGKYEGEDQIEAANELGKRDYIDENNIGIWGWSYGGFMASLAITKGADVFKLAIAVAPVTNWRYYDTVYTERYMQTPQENASGYDDNSPVNFADKLKGDFMIVHGSGDDNVHVQNTMQMVNALVAANKPFELMLYPDRTHGIYRGRNTRLHLYEKMTDFILNNLN